MDHDRREAVIYGAVDGNVLIARDGELQTVEGINSDQSLAAEHNDLEVHKVGGRRIYILLFHCPVWMVASSSVTRSL